jgi:hypothetical protein
MARSRELDRRSFLRALGVAGAGAMTLGAPTLDVVRRAVAQPTVGAAPGSAISRITGVAHPGALRHPSQVESAPDSAVVEVMVDAAMLAHQAVGEVPAAWSAYVSPDDRVLVKVDTVGAPSMASNEAVVAAVLRGLLSAGVLAENVRLYDRQRSHLARAHFRVGESVLGVEVEYGRTRGYRTEATEVPGASCHFANAVDWATALVAIPVLKDDVVCGVGGACATLGYGLAEEGETLRETGPPAILAHLCAAPEVREKLRLVVLDGLRMLYDGGPEDGPAKDPHGTVYVSEDPVAIDTLAMDRIDEARRAQELRTLARAGRALDWLPLAERLGVGAHDRARIATSLHRLAT